MQLIVISDKNRSAFSGKHFKDPLFDTKVFNTARQIMVGYNGGYWDYVETKSGVAFMRIGGRKLTMLRNPCSGETIECDSTLAGMIVTSYAMSLAIEKGVDLYEEIGLLDDVIMDWCSENNRMDVWMAMID